LILSIFSASLTFSNKVNTSFEYSLCLDSFIFNLLLSFLAIINLIAVTFLPVFISSKVICMSVFSLISLFAISKTFLLKLS